MIDTKENKSPQSFLAYAPLGMMDLTMGVLLSSIGKAKPHEMLNIAQTLEVLCKARKMYIEGDALLPKSLNMKATNN